MELIGDNTVDGNIYRSTANNVSAAGTTQGTATALTLDVNNVTTVAAGSGVVLPALSAGAQIIVINSGANALLLYPASGSSVDGLAANTAISISVSSTWIGSLVSATAWETVNNVLAGTTNQITATYAGGITTLAIASNPIWPGTASETIPIGTTAQRPGTPTTGMLRFNSTTGQYEVYDTTWLSLSGILDKSTVSVTQTSTTSANLFSYSVPGGTLGTAGIIRAKLGGTWAVTGGTARSITFTISYGGTTIWQGTSSTLASGSTVPWTMDIELLANNSATAQQMNGLISINATGTPTTGIGSIANVVTSPFTVSPIAGTSAVNSATAQTFLISSVATGATSTLICYYHTLELL